MNFYDAFCLRCHELLIICDKLADDFIGLFDVPHRGSCVGWRIRCQRGLLHKHKGVSKRSCCWSAINNLCCALNIKKLLYIILKDIFFCIFFCLEFVCLV